ncbi:MFS transporter [Allostreptomyces psammosilenae]|uniref:MFS family permease n=1 Tax=Allostreptomyces psammosilenae TaxID=1892865 RepID=A0A852ZYI2_9ACTN|nr:MFS transporter [Allostreptomyces psammosilenae]NYI07209.1 MFS family permease [Allostreptomyces psammosilenae]
MTTARQRDTAAPDATGAAAGAGAGARTSAEAGTEAAPEAASQRHARHPRAAYALLATTQILLIFTITMLSVPLPALQRQFHLSPADLVLLTAAYGLTFSGLLLLGGRLTDRYGPRRTLLAGAALFGTAATAAALAPDATVLLTARFTQGAGAALLAPAAMAALPTLFPDPTRLRRATATWGGLAVIGAATGNLLSGPVTSLLSWRWLFTAPIALTVVLLVTTRRLLPDAPAAPASAPSAPSAGKGTTSGRLGGLDLPGAALWTAGIIALSLGLVHTGDHPWSSAAVLVPLLGGTALIAVFTLVELRHADPLLPPRFLAHPRRLVALAVVLAVAAGSVALGFFPVLQVQQIREWSPARTSAAFVPYVVVLVAAGRIAGRLVLRHGTRAVAVAGSATAGAGLLLGGATGLDGPYATDLLPALLLFPAGAAAALAAVTVAAVSGVPQRQVGLAAGLVNTAMEVGPTVGLAVLASAAAARTSALASAGSPPAEAVTGGYALGLAVVGAALLLLAAVTLRVMRPDRPAETGPPPPR